MERVFELAVQSYISSKHHFCTTLRFVIQSFPELFCSADMPPYKNMSGHGGVSNFSGVVQSIPLACH